MGSANIVNPVIWSVSQLIDNLREGKIVLPRYQRAQVWSTAKQKKLIQSILSGYPVGSLLVYENKTDNKWQLIDGLQRATAIEQYYNKPLEFIDLDTLQNESNTIHQSIEEIRKKALEIKLISESESEYIVSAIENWLPRIDPTSSSRYTPFELAKSIVSYYSMANNSITDPQEIILALNDKITQTGLLDQIRKEINIDNYSIPVIVYSGEKKNLPEIFDRVNTEGTKLSKYDVLAAIWYGASDRVVINDSVIKDAIRHKYESIDGSFLVDEAEHETDDYTLYEYLFGIGKYFVDDPTYNILFRGNQNQSAVESFSFTIACIAYHQRLAEIEKLPDVIREKDGLNSKAALDLSAFFEALKESIDFIRDILRPYIGIEFQKPFIAHTEYQICSYITRALIGRYDNNAAWQEKPNWREDRDKLEQAIPQHYLFELMTKTWGNAGDSKLYNNVWSGSEPSDTYTHGYTKDEWISAINNWFNEDLRKRQTARSSIDDVSKVFLKYVYGRIATADEEKQKFDIDHIFPIKLLAQELKKTNDAEGWPMSAIGNLEFLQSDINAKKRTLTLGKYYLGNNNAPKGMTNEKKKEILKRYSLCEDPSTVQIDQQWNESSFLSFIKHREAILEQKILERFNL